MGIKLRNKKTGEIADLDGWTLVGAKDYITIESDHDIEKIYNYKSLAGLNEEWEDYKPKEPLIKDEKVCKAVRAWLAIQGQPIVKVAITRQKDSDGFFNYRLYGYIEKARISDGKPVANNNLVSIDFEFRSLEKIKFEQHRDYTITELCGEEEK